MDKKIINLLNNNLRVIIPEFGAFIIRQQEPRIIVFNELLNGDDGILLENIMKTEGVEEEIAKQLLTDYVSNVQKTLNNGKNFSIEGLGSIHKEANGRIQFKQEGQVAGADEKKVHEETRKETEEILTLDTTEHEPEIEKEGILSRYGLPVNPGQLIRWVLVIILANLAIVAFFILRNDKKDSATIKEKNTTLVTESVLDQLADSVKAAAADSALVFNDVEATIIPSQGADIPESSLRYYIVAGCFRDEINADDLVSSLISKGYKAEKFGKIGDLYAVSFASFDDKERAVAELAKIRSESHPDAWMTRF